MFVQRNLKANAKDIRQKVAHLFSYDEKGDSARVYVLYSGRVAQVIIYGTLTIAIVTIEDGTNSPTTLPSPLGRGTFTTQAHWKVFMTRCMTFLLVFHLLVAQNHFAHYA